MHTHTHSSLFLAFMSVYIYVELTEGGIHAYHPSSFYDLAGYILTSSQILAVCLFLTHTHKYALNGTQNGNTVTLLSVGKVNHWQEEWLLQQCKTSLM